MAKFPRSYYKDSEDLPAKGRAFPLSLQAFLVWSLLPRFGGQSEKRVRVVFRNPSASERQEGPVAQFRPGELTLLSVPNEIVVQAAVLWPAIVEHCGGLARPVARSTRVSEASRLNDLARAALSAIARVNRLRSYHMRMELQFTAVFRRVPEGYIGFVEELPGANTQGATLDETRANLHEAVMLVLEANRQLAEETAGRDAIRETLKVTA